ncbi:MFS transporter [Micromonospora mirobrigensis]|uniref:MFS transporter, DHA1 family, L-arabinose/isopropyl-beta-D-thiogalactopyranoside export protein n=1 Tax=Micromonospora mirobrigensis TaxID=262898 RepID=A0A1C4WP91_9ACTN|nr:MFS transporter [Micromonospora mirobrigensis]SCE97984.1 MFS transporter, DHA1 family, L-arabinose/isopropyl-beta-D-thiogalactopyranoside export protein [Micromonospora mirobrigensis]
MAGATTDGVRRATVLLALAGSALLFNTTENLPIGLLPLIAADLDVPLPWVGWLVGGYGLAVAAVSLPLAHWTRDVPRRWLLGGVLAVLTAATLLGALTGTYPVLLGARIATAVAQALFWAVTAPVAVGLFSPGVRGRVVAVMSVGGSLATVAGVPAGTWLGQRDGWRLPFLLVAAAALVTLVVVVALLPTTAPEHSHGAYAQAPHTGRFAALLVVTAVSVTGMFTGFTYVTQLLDRAGLTSAAVGPLLGVFGVAGIAGVALVGRLVDRHPRAVLAGTVGGQAVALVGLGLLTHRVVLVALLALLGLAAVPIFMITQARVLHVSPGRTELGFAANSAIFNVGIAAGALLGGLVLSSLGARAAFLAGGLVTVVALAVVLAEPLVTGADPDSRAVSVGSPDHSVAPAR